MMKRLVSLGLLLLLPWQLSFASAEREEHIAKFASHIVVNTDASIDVTETMTVYARGAQIKHGITRSLPMEYTDSQGITHHPHYQIQKVLLNDNISAYHAQQRDGQFIVKVGMKEVVLPSGYYTYTLGYHIDHAIDFLTHADELYWNVTDNDWPFAILETTAEVVLPEGAAILSHRADVGSVHPDRDRYKAEPLGTRRLLFSTGYLTPKQGFIIALSWPKGVVHPPTRQQKIQHSFKANQSHLVLLALAGSLMLYYLLAWYCYARNPKRGPIIPQYEPPQHLSPAAMRFIMRMGLDRQALTAALLSMATKQFLTIENEYDDYTLTKICHDDSLLSPDEMELDKGLFAQNSQLHLSTMTAAIVKKANRLFKQSLRSTFQGIYFKTNLLFLIPGIALTVLAMLLAGLQSHFDPMAIPLLFFMFALNVMFFYAMATPTKAGRVLMDQIEGFKLYLGTIDDHRIRRYDAPQTTHDIFEKYLPYAIALGVESQWGTIFHHALRKTNAPYAGYHPAWYAGVGTSPRVSTFPTLLANGLTTALACNTPIATLSPDEGWQLMN